MSQQPNVLFIIVDQLVPFLTGAYGHPVVKTPNLDRLVEAGIRFDAAYTPCPICGPARAALMTGRYISRIGAYDNAAPLSCDQPTVAHYLSNAGYDTVTSGKLHYVGPDQLHGLSRRLTTDVYPSDFEWTTSREAKGKPMFKGGSHARAYATPQVGVRRWSMFLDYDEEAHFRALKYIRSRRANEDAKRSDDTRPFFLCVSYHHPHEPFLVTQDLWDMYEGEQIDIPEVPDNLEDTYSAMERWLYKFHGVDKAENLMEPESLYTLRRSYYGLVTYVDNKVGELVQALADAGLRDETIIIFISDHGDMLGEKVMVQKRTFYEWSARVPMIISFPDGWQKGTKIDQPASLIDLVPTMLDLAGVENEGRLPLDGQSLMGLIDGSDTAEREVISEMHSEGVYAPCFMIRRGKYKYVYIHGEDPQLFDMEQDPGEWQNLAGVPEYRALEGELKVRILSQFDPDRIEQDVRASLARRRLIRKTMKLNNTHWDYAPYFDETKQYVRGSFGHEAQ